MKIVFHREFRRSYQKLNKKQRQQFKDRLVIFLKSPFDQSLRNHPLRGEYKGYRSINVSGDLRAIYEEIGETAFFIIIGTHSELYD